MFLSNGWLDWSANQVMRFCEAVIDRTTVCFVVFTWLNEISGSQNPSIPWFWRKDLKVSSIANVHDDGWFKLLTISRTMCSFKLVHQKNIQSYYQLPCWSSGEYMRQLIKRFWVRFRVGLKIVIIPKKVTKNQTFMIKLSLKEKSKIKTSRIF